MFRHEVPLMSRRIWTLSLLILLVGTVAQADPCTIYKWTEQQGNVHYTDCPPPPGCKAEIERMRKLVEEYCPPPAGRE